MVFTDIPILQRRKPRLGEVPKDTKETVVLRTGFWKKGAT